MEIKKIEHNFSVCKVIDFSLVNLDSDYCFVGKTDEENSLVCMTENVPINTTERENGWKAFRIQGVLGFSLIGILSKISTLLAENNIGIFAISTFNTDYILTKENNYEKAFKSISENVFRLSPAITCFCILLSLACIRLGLMALSMMHRSSFGVSCVIYIFKVTPDFFPKVRNIAISSVVGG